jgi:hypothetical protein
VLGGAALGSAFLALVDRAAIPALAVLAVGAAAAVIVRRRGADRRAPR